MQQAAAISREEKLLRSATDVIPDGKQLPGYKPLPVQPGIETYPVDPVEIPPELRTPAQEAAFSEPEVAEIPIAITKDETQPEPTAEAVGYDPAPHFLTVDVPVGGWSQITDRLPYRRIVTVLSIGDAAQATFAFRGNYRGVDMLVVPTGSVPFDIPVFPGQELWVQHITAVVQQMSFQIEPRGEGR